MFMKIIFIYCAIITLSFTDSVDSKLDFREVFLDQGGVRGEKYWDGDHYEFYGVPYASVPTGRDKFKAPLPVKPWEGIIDANVRSIVCHQSFYTDDDADSIPTGEDECLVLNLLVPKVADKNNLVPVLVYIHSGAYAVGSANIAEFHYLARHDVIVISINYRLGALGFACLGNEAIPGNAGMKDQVAALKWINKNIEKFGGDPKKVTVAGFSVGAAMAELLALSKSSEGLIDKIILESGSALSPFAVNNDPINTARNIAISLGYNDTGSMEELTEFYLNTPPEILATKSLNFHLPNSTFGFAPCIENNHKLKDSFLTEAPIDIIIKGKYKPVSVLTGFANMEGLSRSSKFDVWIEMMNDKFVDFLPADLNFDDAKSKNEVINAIQKYYFKGEEVSYDTLQGYIDYFSDSMFKYSILKSAKLHSSLSERPVFLYEFSYVGDLNMKHEFSDKIKGASHRDQTSYLLNFYGFTQNYNDMDVRDRMTQMWTDFVKYEHPTAYESNVIDYKWDRFSTEKQYYLHIDIKSELKQISSMGYSFWDNIYKKHYRTPTTTTLK